MSSNPLESLYQYNSLLSFQSPVHYLTSLITSLTSSELSDSDKAKRIFLESNIFTAPAKLPDQEELKYLNKINLPDSAQAIFSVASYELSFYMGAHMVAFLSPSPRTWGCKRAYARDMFKKLWFPMGALSYYNTNQRKEKKLKELADKIEPELSLKDAQQVLWRERKWIYELVQKYDIKSHQVREGQQAAMPALGERIKSIGKGKGEREDKVVERKTGSVEETKKSEKLKKEIEKEKNYMEGLFMDLDDILDEVEGAEIAFIQN